MARILVFTILASISCSDLGLFRATVEFNNHVFLRLSYQFTIVF